MIARNGVQKVVFKSWNKFVDGISSNSRNPGDVLHIHVDSNSDFFDLYTVGKMLASIDLWIFEAVWYFSAGDLNRLEVLELRSRLENGRSKIGKPHTTREKIWTPSRERKTYWTPLLPIYEVELGTRKSKDEASVKVSEITAIIFQYCLKNLEKFESPHLWAVLAEIHRIVNIELRELLHNCFEHSLGRKCYIAIVAKRLPDSFKMTRHSLNRIESGRDLRAIDAIELLVMDDGRGIVDGILSTLKNNDVTRDSSNAVWPGLGEHDEAHDELYHSAELEGVLISQIVNGDLALRRGRKSEGLKQVFHELSWAEGVANIHSGVTDCEYHPTSGSTYVPSKSRSFLPGLIYSSYHLSYALRLSNRGQMEYQDNLPFINDLTLFNLKKIPKSLFGGSPFLNLLRRAEIDVNELVDEIRQYTHSSYAQDKIVCCLDLENSQDVSVSYLDSFIQELARRARRPHKELLAQCVLLRGIRREYIFRLRRMSCNAVLMSVGTFCILLDEFDIPHIIGLPKIGTATFNIEDVLINAFYGYEAPITEMIGGTSKDLEIKDYLRRLASSKRNSLLLISNDDRLFMHRVWEKMRDHDNDIRAHGLKHYELRSPLILYDNGHGHGFDFRSMYADTKILTAAYRAVLGSVVSRGVTNIAYIANNGDRLAMEIACQLSIESVKPIRKQEGCGHFGWSFPSFNGKSALVLDILYEGDLSEPGGEIASLIRDFADKISLLVLGTSSESLIDQFTTRYPTIVVAVALVTNTESDYHDNEAESIVLSSSLQYENTPIEKYDPAHTLLGDDKIDQRQRSLMRSNVVYSDIELSTDFWQHMKEIGYLVTGQARNLEDNREFVVHEINSLLYSNLRVRRQLRSLLKHTVVDRLQQGIEVVMFPCHTVGARIAREVCEFLPNLPVCISLRQPKYGGPISLSNGDIAALKNRLKEFNGISSGKMRALILDDSVVTGSSLIKMHGICALLDIDVRGAFVVLNRLEPATSKTMESLFGTFSYLYRLHGGHDQGHLPVIDRYRDALRKSAGKQSIKQIRVALLAMTSNLSYEDVVLNRNWTDDERDRFVNDVVKLKEALFFASNSSKGEKHQNVSAQNEHVFYELVFNESLDVLDLQTRLLVIQNYLEELLESEFIWDIFSYSVNNEMGVMLSRLLSISFILLTSSSRFNSQERGVDLWKNVERVASSEHVDVDSPLSQVMLFVQANADPEWFFRKMNEHLKTQSSQGLPTYSAIFGYLLSLESIRDFIPNSVLEDIFDSSRNSAQRQTESSPYSLSICVNAALWLGSEVYNKLDYLPYSNRLWLRSASSHLMERDHEVTQYLYDAPGTRYCLASLMKSSGATDVLLFLVDKERSQDCLLTAIESVNDLRKDSLRQNRSLKDIIPEDVSEELLLGLTNIVWGEDIGSDRRDVIRELTQSEITKRAWMYSIKYSDADQDYLLMFIVKEEFDRAFYVDSYISTNAFLSRCIGAAISHVLTHPSSLLEGWKSFKSSIEIVHDATAVKSASREIRLRRLCSSKGTNTLLHSIADFLHQPIWSIDLVEKDIQANIARFYAYLEEHGNAGKEREVHVVGSERGKQFSTVVVGLKSVMYELLRNAFCYGNDRYNINISIVRGEDIHEGAWTANPSSAYFRFEVTNTINEHAQFTQLRGLKSCKQFLEKLQGKLIASELDTVGIYRACFYLPVYLVPEYLSKNIKLGGST